MKNEWEIYKQKRDAINQKNERLIAYWRSLPWYKFWKRPSFEQQRQTIIDNWNKLKPDDRAEFSST